MVEDTDSGLAVLTRLFLLLPESRILFHVRTILLSSDVLP